MLIGYGRIMHDHNTSLPNENSSLPNEINSLPNENSFLQDGKSSVGKGKGREIYNWSSYLTGMLTQFHDKSLKLVHQFNTS